MEDQLSEAYVEVAKLKEENNALSGRNSILEKVLALRDEQLQQATRSQVCPPLGGMKCRVYGCLEDLSWYWDVSPRAGSCSRHP